MIRFAFRLVTFSVLFSFSANGQEFEQQPLFVAGTEGYTFFRIPAVVRSNADVLLAFCEGRVDSISDSGNIDIVMRRSFDGGLTWEALTVVTDDGENTIGNPAPVVDRITGDIFLLSTGNLGTDAEPTIVDGTSEDSRRVYIQKSEDDGQTWSSPVEITSSVKQSNWRWYATGPVHGIQLERGDHAGRLIIPCDHSTDLETFGSHIIYSDDHGASWSIGGAIGEENNLKPNECVAVELVDSRLYLNARDQASRKRRIISYSSDSGVTFSAPVQDDKLIEKRTQGSAIRYSATDQGDAENVILFSNPASTYTRKDLTVRRSYDETTTWDEGKIIHKGFAAYSDMVIMDNGKIGLLYECGENSFHEFLYFAVFDLAYLDVPNPTPSSAYWRLNEQAAGSAASLTAAAILDSYPDGDGFNMTVEGPINYTAGDSNYGGKPALAFEGTQRLSILDSDTSHKLDFGRNDSFTLEASIRVPADSGLTGLIVGKDFAANAPSWWFRVQGGKLRFLVSDGPQEPNVMTPQKIDDGEWHHVAAVLDRSAKTMSIYVDYALAVSGTDTTVSSLHNSKAITIGMANTGGTRFNGDIDFVRISNSALAPEDFIPQDHDGDGLPTTWETQHGLDPYDDGTIFAVNGASGDLDNDAKSNFLEYALGFDPAVATVSSTLMDATYEENRYTVTYSRSRQLSNVDYRIETSADLVNWTDVTSTYTQTFTAIENKVESITLQNPNKDSSSIRFVRMNILNLDE
ncbi:sialidase family protein [Rubellicoccus peritrichatus]|uniref:exo-alpha-sialidase n=1 Tax=Rubellicoccus peritrichatus TaxID=3080537 RepID=A0AAQ3L8L3_9BACT|nr:sialidase family protein [Puniceicoccus sp. CR14]WOO41654.1 sialidase family protein [Puniceicoccus sp. CR14]